MTGGAAGTAGDRKQETDVDGGMENICGLMMDVDGWMLGWIGSEREREREQEAERPREQEHGGERVPGHRKGHEGDIYTQRDRDHIRYMDRDHIQREGDGRERGGPGGGRERW